MPEPFLGHSRLRRVCSAQPTYTKFIITLQKLLLLGAADVNARAARDYVRDVNKWRIGADVEIPLPWRASQA